MGGTSKLAVGPVPSMPVHHLWCRIADEKPGIVYAEMDFAQLCERRANMPLRQQKRADLYALLDLTR